MLVCFGQFLFAVAARRAGLDLAVFGALLARMVALGAEAPAICAGDEIAMLVEEVDMVDLLDRPAGKARLMLDDVLQPRLGRDDVVAPDVLVPGPVCARPHGVDAGQPADIAGHDAAGGKQEARQRDDPAMAGLRGIVGSAPERSRVCGCGQTGTPAARRSRHGWTSRHSRDRTRADCRRRCRAHSGGYCPASPHST